MAPRTAIAWRSLRLQRFKPIDENRGRSPAQLLLRVHGAPTRVAELLSRQLIQSVRASSQFRRSVARVSIDGSMT